MPILATDGQVRSAADRPRGRPMDLLSRISTKCRSTPACWRPRNFEIVRDDLAAKAHARFGPAVLPGDGPAGRAALQGGNRGAAANAGLRGLLAAWTCTIIPRQGTALVGPLDPFWDSKGLVTPQTHRQYCGATVPLLRMKKRTFTSDETFEASVEVAHFGPGSSARSRSGASATRKGGAMAVGRAAGGRSDDGPIDAARRIQARWPSAARRAS